MNQDLAETRAVGALQWIVGQGDLLQVFMAATGSSEADLRNRAGEPEFLAAVMDFLMLDDAWVIDCATDLGWRPDEVMQIRAHLPGGDLPHWT
jgi:hypothetical protein